MTIQRNELTTGTISAIFAFFFWGMFPVYWKLLDSVGALELLAHRIVWALLVTTILVLLTQRRELVKALRDPKALLLAALAGILVGGNWFLFVWAVVSGQILQASLGYYINPLVNVLLGTIILRERLTKAQLAAVGIAAAGVVVLTISYGRVPWISLGLASSFGLYGLVKKTGRLNSLLSLFVELSVLTPTALIYLIIIVRAGTAAFGAGDSLVSVLLAVSGIVTVVPLLLFGVGARRIPLSRLGFIQYIAPTMMLLVGTLIYHEPFSPAHAISFGLIWLALTVYTVTLSRRFQEQPHAVDV
ncbi:MAG: EamA family transporter RarD [Spirochaetales bacterium]|nr:MAG: EamA family transporter RarD [Spirochaetales bacterium]